MEVAWHGNLGEKALGDLVEEAQHPNEDANRVNRSGFLPQHVEALKEVVEHHAVLPGKTDGDGDHGRHTSPEILLPAGNLIRRRYAYQMAAVGVASV